MSTRIYDLSDTWNDSATKFDAVKVDITDLNSASNSTLLNFVVNNNQLLVIDKSGQIIVGSIGSNNVIGLANTLNQFSQDVDEARDAAATYGNAKIYETWVELNGVTGSNNAAAIITSDANTHIDIFANTSVNNSGLYLWKTTPSTGWKWIDNTPAFNAYESALVANTQATISTSAATSSLSILSLVQTLMLTERVYYDTFADAIAGEPVGNIFTTDETGEWAYYKRIASTPYYEFYSYVLTEEFINSSIVGGVKVKENWITLGTSSAANGEVGVVLTNDSGTHTDPIANTTVNNSGVYIRYHTGWKRIANTEAYDAYNASVSANNSMNIATAQAINAGAAATSAIYALDSVKSIVTAGQNYYPYIANGVAATANGYIFNSDEGGIWNFYKKTTTAPYYEFFSSVAIPGGLAYRYEFISANNQTTFVLDRSPNTLQTTVFANGLRLHSSDFGISGNTVVLNTGRANNDVVAVTLQGSLLGASLSSGTVLYNSNTAYANGSVGKALSKLEIVGKNYANDSIAALAGVAVGEMYHTSGTVKVRIV